MTELVFAVAYVIIGAAVLVTRLCDDREHRRAMSDALMYSKWLRQLKG